MNSEHSTLNGCLKCMIGEAWGVMNTTMWILSRETIKPAHLATWCEWVPIHCNYRTSSRCNPSLPGRCACLDATDDAPSHPEPIKYFLELLAGSGKTPLVIDNHIIYWFNSCFLSTQISHSLSCWSQAAGNLLVPSCGAQTLVLKQGLIGEQRDYHFIWINEVKLVFYHQRNKWQEGQSDFWLSFKPSGCLSSTLRLFYF